MATFGTSWSSMSLTGHVYSSHNGCIDTSLSSIFSFFSLLIIQCKACFWYFLRSIMKVSAGSRAGVSKSNDCAFLYRLSSWSCSSSLPSSSSSSGDVEPPSWVDFGFLLSFSLSYCSAISAAFSMPCRLCLAVVSLTVVGCRLTSSNNFTIATCLNLKFFSSEVSFSSKKPVGRLSSGFWKPLASNALLNNEHLNCNSIVSLTLILSGARKQTPSNRQTFWSINVDTQLAVSFGSLPTSSPLEFVKRTTTSPLILAAFVWVAFPPRPTFVGALIFVRSIWIASPICMRPVPLRVAHAPTPKAPTYL